MYTMTLTSIGNPDLQEFSSVSEAEKVKGETLEQMRDLAEQYKEKWELGPGNWANPVVLRNGKSVGFFSYQGRLWKGIPEEATWDDRMEEVPLSPAKPRAKRKKEPETRDEAWTRREFVDCARLLRREATLKEADARDERKDAKRAKYLVGYAAALMFAAQEIDRILDGKSVVEAHVAVREARTE